MKRRKWSKEDISFLEQNYKNMSDKEIAIKLNRTIFSIRSQCATLKISKQRFSPVVVGEKFGRLLVLNKSEKIGKRGLAYFMCKCDCGNIVQTAGWILRRGDSKSCGCYNSDRAKETHRIGIGVGCYNHLENQCKRGARDRDLVYQLSTEDFRKIITQNCYWCGSEPKPWNKFFRKDRIRQKNRLTVTDEWVEQQWVMINGIDRLDNTKGYAVENCAPCCFPCNKMKMNKTIEEFLTQVEKIYEHQQFLKSSRNEK